MSLIVRRYLEPGKHYDPMRLKNLTKSINICHASMIRHPNHRNIQIKTFIQYGLIIFVFS